MLRRLARRFSQPPVQMELGLRLTRRQFHPLPAGRDDDGCRSKDAFEPPPRLFRALVAFDVSVIAGSWH